MKLIDEKGRIFGKINILDFIAMVLAVFLIFLSGLKVLNKDLTDLSVKDEIVNVEVEATIVIDKGYLDVIKVGDQLGEMKHYLDAYVEDVEILPVQVTNLDKDGNVVMSIDPMMEKARIKFKATTPYKNYSYKFGKQELRQGKTIFIESDLYRLKAQIVSLKVVD
ncbi:DUF4330 domain-containing protein [Tissierella praeacuta]|uniref:DUF4330 domain-containing protein n=1 Tax=Tissierella praeacuta TaxID=43131 RepID=UPI001C1176F1|nr:DUF4330 domain-containing protein [Tissierella praeacuta]MBU5255026.1 DUF4330 domain-containing protein [Tissierella praeacuta]